MYSVWLLPVSVLAVAPLSTKRAAEWTGGVEGEEVTLMSSARKQPQHHFRLTTRASLLTLLPTHMCWVRVKERCVALRCFRHRLWRHMPSCCAWIWIASPQLWLSSPFCSEKCRKASLCHMSSLPNRICVQAEYNILLVTRHNNKKNMSASWVLGVLSRQCGTGVCGRWDSGSGSEFSNGATSYIICVWYKRMDEHLKDLTEQANHLHVSKPFCTTDTALEVSQFTVNDNSCDIQENCWCVNKTHYSVNNQAPLKSFPFVFPWCSDYLIHTTA